MAFFGIGFFSNFVYEKSDWDYKSFVVDAGLKAAVEKTAKALDATDTDLKAFKARGGKLILYHGWNDPAITALSTVHYYDSVVAKMGERDVNSFVRLYMAPGMQHCAGGPGPDAFGQVGSLDFEDAAHSVDAALELWVDHHCVEIPAERETTSGDDEAVVSVSAVGEVQGERRYERCGELHVRCGEMRTTNRERWKLYRVSLLSLFLILAFHTPSQRLY
jgi:hypothetical protein